MSHIHAVENMMSGLLEIAADSLRRLPASEASAIMQGVEGGTMALSFNVSMTGAATAIVGQVQDVTSGSVRPFVDLLVSRPDGAARAGGLQ